MYDKRKFDYWNKDALKYFKSMTLDIINSKDKSEVRSNIRKHLNDLKDYLFYLITKTDRYFDSIGEGNYTFCSGIEKQGIEDYFECWKIPELRAKIALNAIENNNAKCYFIINGLDKMPSKKDFGFMLKSNEDNYDEISGQYLVNTILPSLAKDLRKFLGLNESKETFKDLFNF